MRDDHAYNTRTNRNASRARDDRASARSTRTSSRETRGSSRDANASGRRNRSSSYSSRSSTLDSQTAPRSAQSSSRSRNATRDPYKSQKGRTSRTVAATASPTRRPLVLAAIAAAILLLAVLGCTAFNHATNGTRGGLAEHIDSTAVAMKPRMLTFLAVGDIVPHKEMIEQSRVGDGSYDFNDVFEPVRSRLEPYDLLSVTQETPLVTDESRVGGYPIFGTPVQMGDAIVNAGFGIVTSATNHSMDQGIDGIFDTIDYWKQNHPEIVLMGLHDNPADANGVTFVERNGITIAMTDLTYSLNGFELPADEEYAVDMLYDLDAIAANVEAAQDKADITICYVHMGDEYATVPSAEQREVAERLIDAGADVVLGSHVHVVQPMEEVTTPAGNTGIVYFSLGNFASNQANVENMLGGAAVLTIAKIPHLDGSSETTVTAHEFVPTFCHYDYDTTKMYFLDDYTDELASGHFITLYGHPFTVDQVNEIWTDITGLPR